MAADLSARTDVLASLACAATYVALAGAAAPAATPKQTPRKSRGLFALGVATILSVQIVMAEREVVFKGLLFTLAQVVLIDGAVGGLGDSVVLARFLLLVQLFWADTGGSLRIPWALVLRGWIGLTVPVPFVELAFQIALLFPTTPVPLHERTIGAAAAFAVPALFELLLSERAWSRLSALVVSVKPHLSSLALVALGALVAMAAKADWALVWNQTSQVVNSSIVSEPDFVWKVVAVLFFLVAMVIAVGNGQYWKIWQSTQEFTSTSVFWLRAVEDDRMTYQAAMAFVHMLLVLFFVTLNLLHLGFVNLIVMSTLVLKDHSYSSRQMLSFSIVYGQVLTLFVLRDELSQVKVGIGNLAEQVALVFCSIRLVSGAVLTDSFSAHAFETLFLTSAALFANSNPSISSHYLLLVLSWMALFAGHIRVSSWTVASTWLESEAEIRSFMDHELRVSFAGIMLALEHCLTDEVSALLPSDMIEVLREALAECGRGKDLCFQVVGQRLLYDESYEVKTEGRELGKAFINTWKQVEHVISPEHAQLVVVTDWNLVFHVADNAVANAVKYGSNAIMTSSIIFGESDQPPRLLIELVNEPVMNDNYRMLLEMPDTSVLFYDSKANPNHQGSGKMLASGLGSTHLGLPVARRFAERLHGQVSLKFEESKTTFTLEIPVSLVMNSSSEAPFFSSPQMVSLPAGLKFAVLDDSSMIRSTMLLMLKRDLNAHPDSFVVGEVASEAESFAERTIKSQVNMAIIDEALDYGPVAYNGTEISRSLRNMGFQGLIIIYSANEDLKNKLDMNLFDGFASKSQSKVEMKRTLTRIYAAAKAARGSAQSTSSSSRGSSTPMAYSLRPVPAVETSKRSGSGALLNSAAAAAAAAAAASAGGGTKTMSEAKASAGGAPAARDSDLANVPLQDLNVFTDISVEGLPLDQFAERGMQVTVDLTLPNTVILVNGKNLARARALHLKNPKCGVVGTTSSFALSKLSPLAIVALGASLKFEQPDLTVEDVVAFSHGLDALCSPTACSPEFLCLVAKAASSPGWPQARFDETSRDQDYDQELLSDFRKDDNLNILMVVMRDALMQSMGRICKKPSGVTVKRIAHTTKGAAAQLGARALFRASAALESACEEGQPIPVGLFHTFFQLLAGFVEEHKDLV